MIELKDVYKTFDSVRAVDGISFKAEEGQIFGLIGPNGAGKSTTIRMIMNILAPDRGTIMFSGKKIEEKDKERIGYLPEERGLYRKVKVNDLLLYFSALKGKNKKVSQKSIDYWLDAFDLLEWKDHKVEDLSKGMSQKIQFIAAVVHDPELLFFDEPFSGIDPVSSDLITRTIQDLGKKGKTILFSTHIMESAEKICSTIFLINKGKEVISGPLQEVKNRYGKKSVIVEADGDNAFLQSLPYIQEIFQYPRWLEVQLKNQDDTDRLLKDLVDHVHVRKFEIAAPSLHNIFVSLVGSHSKEGLGNE